MYVPNSVSLFGSAEIMLTTRGKARDSGAGEWVAQYAYLDIKKTKTKYLNRPSLPCTGKSLNPNVTACIIEYIQAKIGCSANIQGLEPSRAPSCTTKQQFKDYMMLSKKLQYADDAKVYDMTGCLSSCEKDKFEIALTDRHEVSRKSKKYRGMYNVRADPNKGINRTGFNTLDLFISIRDSSYTEEEQYYIYDWNSFVADVGGYMGLILGCSFLSLYDKMEHLLRTSFGKLSSTI